MSTAAQLPAERFAALHAVGTPTRYRQGAHLFREGDRSDHVVLVVRGVAKVFATAESGYQTVLAIRTAGEIVGEFAAFDGRPRSASVVALTDVDSVLVGGHGFRRYLRGDPELALAMLGGLVDRLRESDRRRMEFGAYDVTQRLCRLLLEFTTDARDAGGAAGAPAQVVALSQQELAGIVGASREAVARVLRMLRGRGAIGTARLRITVLRPDLLRRLSDLDSATPPPSSSLKGAPP